MSATEGNAKAGQFIGPDGRGESWGYPTIVQPAATAKDPDIARHPWNLSEELTGVHYKIHE